MQKAKEETKVLENSSSTCAIESTKRNLNQHQSKLQSSLGPTTKIFFQIHLVAS